MDTSRLTGAEKVQLSDSIEKRTKKVELRSAPLRKALFNIALEMIPRVVLIFFRILSF
jgi:hypothetical protein